MCDLLQDNAKLKSDMEKLLRAMEKGTKPAVKAKGKACPSKPHSSAEPEESDADGEDREEPDAEVSASGSGGEEDLSEAAKRARLRRLCEKKGSGKLNVPEEVHLLWKKGGHTRDQLAELLEESGFEKDPSVIFRVQLR